MREVLELIFSKLCARPVQIDESSTEQSKTFVIHAALEDTGKIIGANGSVISAIRTIMKSLAFGECGRGAIVHIDVVDHRSREQVEAARKKRGQRTEDSRFNQSKYNVGRYGEE